MLAGELKNILRSPLAGGLYLFAGEEDYLKKYYLGEFRRAIITDEAFEAFNYIHFFGETPDFSAIIGALMAPPMMSDMKLIVCENIEFDSKGDRERERLISDMEALGVRQAEFPDSVLIFLVKSSGLDIGSPRRRSATYTRLAKAMIGVEFDYSDDRHLAPWISRHFADWGVRATPDVCTTLIRLCGHSMTTLSGEVCKIAAYTLASGRSEATVEDVLYVASPVEESEAFALTNALLDGNRRAALDALADMIRRRVEPVIAIGSVVRFYSELSSVAELARDGMSASDIAKMMKIHEYKVKLYISAARKRGQERLSNALDACRRIDVASKTGGIGGYTALEMFISSPDM